MKKIIFTFVVLVMTTCYGYAQNTLPIDSKEEAIDILKGNEFFDILRYTADSMANIDRFVREICKIVPVDQEKSDLLKAQLLSVLQKKEGYSQHWSLLYWPIGQAPDFGVNIKAVLKDNFNVADYEKVLSQAEKNLNTAYSAYRYLVVLQKEELDWVVLGFTSTSEHIKKVYDYFGI